MLKRKIFRGSLALMLCLTSASVMADEEVFGQLVGIDKAHSCLVLGAVCYAISNSQKSSILNRAVILGVGSDVQITLREQKVIGIERSKLIAPLDNSVPQ